MLRVFPSPLGRAGAWTAGMMLAVLCATPLRADDPSKPTRTTPTGTTAAGANTSGSPTSGTATTPSVSSDRDVIAYINKYIRQGWADNEVSPSAAAGEYEWCRRIFLDLLGRTPKVEEL